METVRLWVTGVAYAAIIAAIIIALSPGDGAGKSVKTAVSIFLISSMILPFASVSEPEFDSELSISDSNCEISENIAVGISTRLEKKLCSSIGNILSQNGIHTDQVSIDIKTSGDEISVEKVTVILKKEDADLVLAAKELLETELQLNAEVLSRDAEG